MMLLPVSRILLSILCVSSVSGCLPPNFFQALFQPQVIVTTTTTTTTTSSISTGTTTSTSSSSSSSVSTEEPLTGKLRNATGYFFLAYRQIFFLLSEWTMNMLYAVTFRIYQYTVTGNDFWYSGTYKTLENTDDIKAIYIFNIQHFIGIGQFPNYFKCF